MTRLHVLSQPRREPEAAASPLHYLWAFLAGATVPGLVIVFGVIAVLLDRGRFAQPTVRLGTYLRIPLPGWFLLENPLSQLAILVLLAMVLCAVFSLAVWLHRRGADRRARRLVKALHLRVLKQSLRRAEVEGAAAQRARAEQLIAKYLPELSRGLSLWNRSIPRSVVLFVGCVALALAVNVWLAVLAVASGVVIWRLYHRLRHPDWLELSRFEVPQIRERLIAAIGDAPMMAHLQAGELARKHFEEELEALERRLAGDDARRGRLWPALMFAGSLAIAVMLLGLGVNSFQADQGLTLPAALVLGLSLTGAAFAAARLSQLGSQLRRSERASDMVYLYLQTSDEVASSEQRVGLAGLRDSVRIENVTLQDSAGQPILHDLSLSLHPKSLVALLGTDAVSTQALLELLMGFGRPARGRVQIDGIPLLDVHPLALSRNVMWIGSDGPLWEGTLLENLASGLEGQLDQRDVVRVLEQLGIYERISRLSDGMNTFVQPAGEYRDGGSDQNVLGSDTRYALGVARAILHRPPIILAKEPPAPTEHVTEDPCLAALTRMARDGALVVVLPHRIKTLRSCDRVVLLNGPHLAGEGRHSELLSSSDLYRHLNYLLFNPYRNRG